jgi:L-amino acid N-acyltransferase YncA
VGAAGVGIQLYEEFYELATKHGRGTIHAITSANNSDSITFHRRLGFDVSDPIEGYDRPGVTHVRFTRSIS